MGVYESPLLAGEWGVSFFEGEALVDHPPSGAEPNSHEYRGSTNGLTGHEAGRS